MARRLDSVRKRWHALTVSPRRLAARWSPPYWVERSGYRDIDCANCRRFDAVGVTCKVRFGSPMRKCATAAIEANLHDCAGLEALEIGFGRWMLPRTLVRRSGGRWTGIDPGQPREKPAQIGQGGYGEAGDIPFPDAAFDLVFGIQSFEHWGQRAGPARPSSDYDRCMHEILRVLKPGGRLYLDAPIHYHGHEMFIVGDVERLRRQFDGTAWESVTMQRWRRRYEPLERFLPPPRVQAEWPIENVSYGEEALDRVRDSASAWLLTFTARKAAPAP